MEVYPPRSSVLVIIAEASGSQKYASTSAFKLFKFVYVCIIFKKNVWKLYTLIKIKLGVFR